ncbi:MAG: thioredoxin family protein, partial [Candidatus Hydrogenedentes bacterium]|nr:thioredoxin family protein [Candidatus Hydrogenedentota bacterium]
ALVAAAGEKPLLVDFYSPSCMPCRATAPALNTLAAEGHRVAVVNVDEAHKLAWEYEVSAIPALLVFRDGKVAKRAQGYHTAEGLRALIEG